MFHRGIAWIWLGVALIWLAIPQQSSAQMTWQEKHDRAVAAELDVDSQEIVALEKETAHALSLNNASFFARVYADDYQGTAATGEFRDRNALVSSIEHSTARYSAFVVTNISVRIYGPTAVVTCTWSTRGVQDGRNFARQYRVIHVYVNNRAGGWRVIAGQETMLPG
jgi:uncharacterized protein (TIGR02246 family)